MGTAMWAAVQAQQQANVASSIQTSAVMTSLLGQGEARANSDARTCCGLGSKTS